MGGGWGAAPNESWSGLSRGWQDVKQLGREADHSSPLVLTIRVSGTVGYFSHMA